MFTDTEQIENFLLYAATLSAKYSGRVTIADVIATGQMLEVAKQNQLYSEKLSDFFAAINRLEKSLSECHHLISQVKSDTSNFVCDYEYEGQTARDWHDYAMQLQKTADYGDTV